MLVSRHDEPQAEGTADRTTNESYAKPELEAPTYETVQVPAELPAEGSAERPVEGTAEGAVQREDEGTLLQHQTHGAPDTSVGNR